MANNPFNVIQTFYIEGSAVSNISEVVLTSVELYVKNQPAKLQTDNASSSVSGIASPGIVVSICEVNSDIPDPSKIVPGSITRCAYENINPMADASSSSVFKFGTPISIKTNQSYGIVIAFEDQSYELWTNRSGDRLIGTNTASPGPAALSRNSYYQGKTDNTFNSITGMSLKYKLNIAQYTSASESIQFVNGDYEFFTLTGMPEIAGGVGNFVGGELVYRQNVSDQGGTVNITKGSTSVVGSGTDFTQLGAGTYIVVTDGVHTNVLAIDYVISATVLQLKDTPTFSSANATFKSTPVGRVYYSRPNKNVLYLTDSTANNMVVSNSAVGSFGAGSILHGIISNAVATIQSVDNYPVNVFTPHVDITTHGATQASANNAEYSFSWFNGTTYEINPSRSHIVFNDLNRVVDYPALVMSRSNEVFYGGLFTPQSGDTISNLLGRKSCITELTLNVDNTANTPVFASPTIDTSSIDYVTKKYYVSNTYTNTVTSVQHGVPGVGDIIYDTEVGKNGVALSKHISKKVTFATDKYAEDIKIYVNAYRPANTEIRLYCKVQNAADPESFDDKAWSPMVITNNGDKRSSSTDRNDILEYTYSLPPYSESAYSLPDYYTAVANSDVITFNGSTGSPGQYIQVDDVIKIYDPLFPENYMVTSVVSIVDTVVTISEPVKSNDIIGSGRKVDKVKYPTALFNNDLNSNVCRYFNLARSQFDKFNSMQLKIVLLADTPNVVPEVDNYQFIGVSA